MNYGINLSFVEMVSNGDTRCFRFGSSIQILSNLWVWWISCSCGHELSHCRFKWVSQWIHGVWRSSLNPGMYMYYNGIWMHVFKFAIHHLYRIPIWQNWGINMKYCVAKMSKLGTLIMRQTNKLNTVMLQPSCGYPPASVCHKYPSNVATFVWLSTS